ncbi:2-oxo acid dehydrogenase subunit E2 [Psychroflexus sp. YR1-1]|uniref:Dihydrolipoamide acetyltransferase component of pyruvate dehydrogenase complex n=1 Tax=Psychroflexus aurantiacus TaxID=2709310 RepID=A0A6B3R374_9FLAO|nr:dihydrolipoamide acetyltransferase family protein [Psychroflexus aurantiacus]NEV94913.1 2-oxo acid dehydrogenase subunit E2 [Psychroflexus aurantiacus]
MNNNNKTSETLEFKLPKMGESITEGTILNWMINEGGSFQEGDILVEVGTDKVDNEVPAPCSGRLVEIRFEAKEVVKIGEVIAILESSGQAESPSVEKESKANTSEKQTERQAPKAPRKQKTKAQAQTTNAEWKPGTRGNQFYSPLVEKIARDYHISYEELARVPASGADDRLKKSDIYKYLEDGRPAQFAQPVSEPSSGFQVPDLKFDKGKGKLVEMDRMRQMIADHMVFSKHTSPHVTAYVEADMTKLVNWRNKNKAKFQEETGEKLTFTPLFIQAVTKAIQDFPMINSSLDGNNIIVKEDINIGMATALPSGNLIVPVVKNSDQKDLKTLAKEVNALVVKARDNKLTSDDTRGSTFTISNVGTFGSLMGTPIINQPEAAILATGIIKKRAEVIEYDDGDQIEIRQMMYLSLSFDHRIVDGYLAGSFLRRIADYLED